MMERMIETLVACADHVRQDQSYSKTMGINVDVGGWWDRRIAEGIVFHLSIRDSGIVAHR